MIRFNILFAATVAAGMLLGTGGAHARSPWTMGMSILSFLMRHRRPTQKSVQHLKNRERCADSAPMQKLSRIRLSWRPSYGCIERGRGRLIPA